jgi:hypothetical protein
MNQKSKKSARPEDIKKQLEALTGHDLPVPADHLIKGLVYPASTYSYSASIERDSTCWRGFAFPLKNCVRATLLDVSGAGLTDTNGQSVFLLSDFVCFATPLYFVSQLADPINVVATPRTTSPLFLTETHSLFNNNSDVQITVFTWDANGKPAPSVAFDWRCRVVAATIIF